MSTPSKNLDTLLSSNSKQMKKRLSKSTNNKIRIGESDGENGKDLRGLLNEVQEEEPAIPVSIEYETFPVPIILPNDHSFKPICKCGNRLTPKFWCVKCAKFCVNKGNYPRAESSSDTLSSPKSRKLSENSSPKIRPNSSSRLNQQINNEADTKK